MIWFFISLILIAYLVWDYSGPATIKISPSRVFGLNCLIAKDLLVQEYDSSENLWASRGMIIYKLKKGENKFRKIAHVPTGYNLYWLRNFTLLRKLTLRPECIEFTIAENGDMCAFSSGNIWHYSILEGSFSHSMKVRHFGKGNQGLRNVGLTISKENVIYFGEYFRNKERGPVNIYRSFDNGKSWQIAYQFPASEIRHIHGIQTDPYTGFTYFLSGDLDNESKVGFTKDNFNSIEILGEGSQTWRICQLVFTEKSIIWGTDTSDKDSSGVFILNKKSGNVTKIAKVAGAVFFGTILKNGLIIFTTNRENNKLEFDDYTRLYVVNENLCEVEEIIAGTWKHKNRGFWFKYAQLRIQRYQEANSLAISVLNQKEVNDNDLLIIDGDSLLNFITKKNIF